MPRAWTYWRKAGIPECVECGGEPCVRTDTTGAGQLGRRCRRCQDIRNEYKRGTRWRMEGLFAAMQTLGESAEGAHYSREAVMKRVKAGEYAPTPAEVDAELARREEYQRQQATITARIAERRAALARGRFLHRLALAALGAS